MASPSTPARTAANAVIGRDGDRRRACARVRFRASLPVPFPAGARYGRSATARPAATVSRPACSTPSLWATVTASTGMRSSSASRSDRPGDVGGGAGEDGAVDRLRALLHAVEVQRVAHGVGDLVHALVERGARGGHELGVAVDLVERRDEADMPHPLAGVLEREAAALGERRRHRVDAAGGGAREQAARRVGDGHVDEPGGVDVEHGALGLAGVHRADHAEGGEVEALELEAGLADGADDALDHLAADGDDDDAGARPGQRLDRAERLHVEDGLVDRHRDLVGSLQADGGEQRLLVLHHGDVERAHDDPLVGDAQAHALGQVVLLEEGAQRLGQARRDRSRRRRGARRGAGARRRRARA